MHWRELLPFQVAHLRQDVSTQCRSFQNACHSPETETPRRFLRKDTSRQSLDAGPSCSRLGSSQADEPRCPLLFRVKFAVPHQGNSGNLARDPVKTPTSTM